jgi:hypothetical protein
VVSGGFFVSAASGLGAGSVGEFAILILLDAAGSCAGTGATGWVKIIRIDVPTEINNQFKDSSRDFQVRFILGPPMQKALFSHAISNDPHPPRVGVMFVTKFLLII